MYVMYCNVCIILIKGIILHNYVFYILNMYSIKIFLYNHYIYVFYIINIYSIKKISKQSLHLISHKSFCF